jgi:parallel beta-helix repeat protein
MRSLKFFGLGMALISVVLMPGSLGAAQKTITVCSSGCDYTRIQQAIDAAQPGDTIQIQAGYYLENIEIKNKSGLTLQGTGPEQATLDGGLGLGQQKPAILVESSQTIIIKGFKIIGGGAKREGPGGGIEVQNSTAVEIRSNVLENNLRQGILIQKSSGVTVAQNQISKTQPLETNYRGRGINLLESQGIEILQNEIFENAESGIVVLGSQAEISKNIIRDNGWDAIRVSSFPLERPSQVTVLDNEMRRNSHCGINSRLSYGGDPKEQFSTVTGSGNKLSENKFGDLCGDVPTELLADFSQGTREQVTVPTDAPTIQEAVHQVQPGGTVLIQAGRYQELVQIYKSVKIVGAGKDQVTLQAKGPDWLVMNVASRGLQVELEGVTIQGGMVGIQVQTGLDSQLILRHVSITDQKGDALEVSGVASAEVSDSTISDNGSSGVAVWDRGRTNISRSTLTDNGDESVYIVGWATAEITNAQITNTRRGYYDDYGFGILVSGHGKLALNKSTISNNASVGVLVIRNTQAIITQNTITNNTYGIQIGEGGDPEDKETVQAEISGNTIQKNKYCGIYADDDPGIKITGQGNTISGNKQGELCGDTTKFPPGFGGGK